MGYSSSISSLKHILNEGSNFNVVYPITEVRILLWMSDILLLLFHRSSFAYFPRSPVSPHSIYSTSAFYTNACVFNVVPRFKKCLINLVTPNTPAAAILHSVYPQLVAPSSECVRTFVDSDSAVFCRLCLVQR